MSLAAAVTAGTLNEAVIPALAARRARPSPPLWQEFALEAVRLLAPELREVESRIASRCGGIAGPLPEACRYLVTADGKRLRPVLALLGARIAGAGRSRAIHMAAAAELVHSASLLHDDVLDDGTRRRGKEAVRVIWGNRISILGGNHLLVAALLELSACEAGDTESMLRVLDELVEGEVMQHALRTQPIVTAAVYQEVVARKTASLIGWPVSAAARGTPAARPLAHYGFHLGIAFQMVDDLLDVTGEAAKVGKNLASDVREGKPSLPLVAACEIFPEAAREARRLFRLPEDERTGAYLDPLMHWLKHPRTLAAARGWIQSTTRQALNGLDALPPSEARSLLERATLALEHRAL
ncbi:MAG: polyprenyl synthetase family protein [Deltaproteobacteria bacterium]|nr:polyprenyl synthetase family protein [Deltaproteobacteria bacterium]